MCYTVAEGDERMQRILIVEDDFDISEMLCAWLGEAGYETAAAADGLPARNSIWFCSI